MHIRLITAESPADPATHGVLAGVVSVVLGVAAHGFGGGFGAHGPATSHVVILVALAVVVGVVRAGQVRGERRAGGSGRAATAAALIGGQIATHAALALLGHGAIAPDTSMLVWHVIALPAAVAVLVVAERLARMYGSQVAVVRALAEGFEPDDIVPTAAVPVVARRYTLALQSASGVRGPPATV